MSGRTKDALVAEYSKNGGNIKQAVLAVSRDPTIGQRDQARLRTLSMVSDKEQEKLVHKVWEETLALTGKRTKITQKLEVINGTTGENRHKLSKKLVNAKKLPFMATLFCQAAGNVVGRLLRAVLTALRFELDEIENLVQDVTVDFLQVKHQVEKDLVLCQNEEEILALLDRL